ncbi:MAG: hypothetical protein PVI50_03640 [Gammaproteobacteria bacterium]|jgi:hypothetical protein
MADIIRFRKPAAADKARGGTLCRRGFHKWEAMNETPFDSKRGRLVTGYRCARCGALKTAGR